MPEFVGAIDQGTTSTRFMVFDGGGEVRASAQKEHRQIFPNPGWVEHDPMEIWSSTVEVIETALARAGLGASDLAGVGIANQRETTVLWNRATGEPLANAVVWQDTRTDRICADLAAEGGPDRFRDRTGLPIATYFSGPKIRWLLDETGLRDRAERGEVAFGTIDSWLAWNLTGRHVTDSTNASRTLLYDLATDSWGPDLAAVIGVPETVLPEIVDSVGVVADCGGPLAGVPLAAMLGDQQAALFGQACFLPGEAKNTYGTGNFLLLHTGDTPVASAAGLITTVASRFRGEPVQYALEGAIAVTGSLVQWLRDNLGIISDASEVEELAASVDDTGDVYFVPAFSGLFAPHWRSDARGVIVGLTRFIDKRHLARAALEATAFQTQEVLAAMADDSGVRLTELRVDGGMSRNDLLMQIQADVLGIDIVRPRFTETTVLGAAYAAGLATGLWKDRDEVKGLWAEDRRWSPRIDFSERTRLTARWSQAIQRSLGWA
ncbi:MAG TPA: glycerol kinase GlpK [Acidimicrobiia bacterium]